MNIKNIFFAIIISNVALANSTTPTAAYEFSPSEKQELHKATINGACLGAKEGMKILTATGGAFGATVGILVTGILWYVGKPITIPTNKEAVDTFKRVATSDITKVAGCIAGTFVSTSAVFGGLIMRNETAEAIKNGTYYQPYSLELINIKTSIQLLEVLSTILNALSRLQTR